MILDPSLASSSFSSFTNPSTSPPSDNPSPATNALDASDSDPSHYLIRATQGHSIAIAAKNLLTPLTPATAPCFAVHGTYLAAWPLILAAGGLKPMSRTHIHFVDAAMVEGGDAVAVEALAVNMGSKVGAGGAAGGEAAAVTTTAEAASAALNEENVGRSEKPSSTKPQTDSPSRGPPPARTTEPLPSHEAQHKPHPDPSNKTPRKAPSHKKPISGARASAEIYIYVDVHRSMNSGNPSLSLDLSTAPLASHPPPTTTPPVPIQWWQSANNVLLTAGDPASGLLSTDYFHRVVRRRDRAVLWEGGVEREGYGAEVGAGTGTGRGAGGKGAVCVGLRGMGAVL